MDNMTSSGTIVHSQWGGSHLPLGRSRRFARRDGEDNDKADGLERKGQPRGLDHTTAAKMAGDRNVWCETEAELMAVKLNRSEQYKLKTYNTLVMKEMNICKHRFQQQEKELRKKSAQLKSRMKQIENEHSNDMSFFKPLNHRPEKLLKRRRSSDSEADIYQVRNANHHCDMCSQIQTIISSYEEENYPSSERKKALEHSTCLFSDVQLKSFINLMESEHFRSVPNVAARLTHNQSASTLISRSKSSSNTAKHPHERIVDVSAIAKRVKDFCVETETFNKANNTIPDSVRVALEKTRHEDAVLLKAPPPGPMSLRTQIELLFDIKRATR